MRMRTVVGGSMAAFAIVAGSSLGAGALTGSFDEIDPPDDENPFVSPRDVNDADQVTGYANFGGNLHGFVRDSDGTYTELMPPDGSGFSQGEAINASGVVVGGADGLAALWEPGEAPLALGTLAGDTSSFAQDVNDDGFIVGTSNNGGTYRSWVFDPSLGNLVDMGTISGSTVVQVVAINNAGVAVGRALVAGEFVPFVWTDDDGIVAMPLPDGEVTFEPDDIDGSGNVVGHVFEFVAPEGFYRAYLFDGVTFTPLTMDGYTTAFPQGLNDAGLVVGFVDNEGSSSRTPAAWDTASGDATAFPLFDDAAFTNELVAVNNSSLAVGVSRAGDDVDAAWLGQINPDPQPTAPTAPPAEPVPAAASFTG